MKRWLTSAAYQAGRRAAAAHPRASAWATPRGEAVPPAIDQLTAWLARLRLLHGVPFHYLVPDQRMLPPESIRFFTVDPNWVTALVDGALSLGRSTTGDADPAQPPGPDLLRRLVAAAPDVRAGHLGLRATPAAETPPEMSGFVLRSGVVTGWPSLEVLAFDATQAPLTLLRLERAAGAVLMGLFAGRVQRVAFREPAETLHFGVELPATADASFTKALKYVDVAGHPTGALVPDVRVPVPLRDAARRVVDVLALQTQLKSSLLSHGALSPTGEYTAAQFALEMVQGVQQVDFTLSAAPTL